MIFDFLKTYLLRYKKTAALSLLFMLLVAVSRMAPPYILKIAIDRYIARGDFPGLTVMALFYLVFITGEYIAIYFQVYATQLFGQSIIRDMRQDTFNHLVGLPVPYFDKTPHGKSLHYVTSDMENINEFITSGLVTTIGDVITIAGILVVMCSLSIPLTAVVFIFFFFLFLATNFFGRRFTDSYRHTRESVSQMNGFLEESLAGIYVSKAFHRKASEIERFRNKNERYMTAFKQVIYYLSLYFPLVESVGILTILAILWASGQLLVLGAITLGTIVAFIEYSHKIYNPIRDLSEKYNLYQNALSSLEKLQALHVIPEERHSGADEEVRGDIEFRDVWLSYGDDESYALKGINLRIREGERLGIVGLTGSGKTSLINLMLGFYRPTRGEILIGGKPLETYSIEAVRKAFGIVSQDVYIFPRTIRENLFTGEGGSLPPDLAHVLSDSFGGGLDQVIAEEGLNLSEGEKQLIAIGRMLNYRPRYVILDEATSRIDRYLEERVQGIIAGEFGKATWMVIAHRMSTIAQMDRIIVIHDGELAEEGNHQELLELKGIYRHLYTIYMSRRSNEHLNHQAW